MRRAYKPMKAIFAGSDYSIARLKAAGLTKITKAPLGTHPDTFNPKMRSQELRTKLGVPKTGKLILYMGRLAPEKGIGVLLDAAKHLLKRKDIVVLIAGMGHWSRKVKIAAAELPGKLILIEKANTTEQAAQLMASADVFVSAGPLETFSLTTLEALSSATPVAACAQAAAAELVTKAGGTSTYSPWNSGKALSEAVLDAAAATQPQKDAFRNFARDYTWNSCFTRIFDAYNTVL